MSLKIHRHSVEIVTANGNIILPRTREKYHVALMNICSSTRRDVRHLTPEAQKGNTKHNIKRVLMHSNKIMFVVLTDIL